MTQESRDLFIGRFNVLRSCEFSLIYTHFTAIEDATNYADAGLECEKLLIRLNPIRSMNLIMINLWKIYTVI